MSGTTISSGVGALGPLTSDPVLGHRITHVEHLPARAARTATLEHPLHPDVAGRLGARGVTELWTHQVEAVDGLRDGHHVVVATGTSSGKSLCYQLPIIESVVAGTRDTALLLFPTKALAQDQLRSLRSWLVPGLRAVTYDGDTPPEDRTWARGNANVVLTNPDMLHVGMLPFHEKWGDFFARLRWVVVDELHALRGIFGSHVAHILRRLRRVCAHYGSSPSFCFSSATIGNPAELAASLSGLDITAVTADGSPAGDRWFATWQRPLLDEDEGPERVSANTETALLLARFVADGRQTLAFTRSRRGAEVVARLARSELETLDPPRVDTVATYRAGYLPRERRELEQQLSDGRLLGVAATNALELGIDIGGLDAVVLNGFPGTLASMWQQAGRAGRSGRDAAAVLVAGDDQLDQWYLRNPDELFTRPLERAVVNPDNPYVLGPQVRCAAHEIPLTPHDEEYFGDGLDEAVRALVHDDLLKPRGGRMFWAGGRAPAPDVGLRSGSGSEVQLVDAEGELVGTVDAGRAMRSAHEGAIYLHQGRQYRVRVLDLDGGSAHLDSADDVDEYTQVRVDTDIDVIEEQARAPAGRAEVHRGRVEVTNTVVAYQRRRSTTRELIGTVPLDLPPLTLHTTAVWYTVELPTLLDAGLDPSQVLGSVHAAEHAMIGMLPRFAICDRWDVGGVSMAEHPATGTPTIFIYDGYDGGAGIADLAFAASERHVADTIRLVSNCECTAGCPSCVQSPKCGNWNEYLDKDGATVLLTAAAGADGSAPGDATTPG
ncbi:MAG: DEAD/DEAH box helicase [Acidimicrobiia bacterium]